MRVLPLRRRCLQQKTASAQVVRRAGYATEPHPRFSNISSYAVLTHYCTVLEAAFVSIMCILFSTAVLNVASPVDAIFGSLPGYAVCHSFSDTFFTDSDALRIDMSARSYSPISK